jgi:hypothetical protein
MVDDKETLETKRQQGMENSFARNMCERKKESKMDTLRQTSLQWQRASTLQDKLP